MENRSFTELLLGEQQLHGKGSANPLKFIGCTFEDGKLTAVKSYCESQESDERGFYSFGKEKAVSDFVNTKGLKTKALEAEIRSFAKRAFSGDLFSAGKSGAAGSGFDADTVSDRIILDLRKVLEFNGGSMNPLFDLGVLRSSDGLLKEIKYYLCVEKYEKQEPVDNLGLVKDLCGGVFVPGKAARELWQLSYRPTLFGVNVFYDGRLEYKLYFDVGRAPGFCGDLLGNSKKALCTVADLVTVSEADLDVLFEYGLFLRGVGLEPRLERVVRLYFDAV